MQHIGRPGTFPRYRPVGCGDLQAGPRVAPAKGGGHEVMLEEQGSVRLGAGDHRVECILSDGTHTTELLVVPARPGYEEGGTG